MNKSEISRYYDYTAPFYRFFWHGNTNAIHYGFWDKDTKNLKEALLNTNKFLAEKAKISSGSKILDAGCGIGGSALWIAKNIGAKVTGISISKRQIGKAKYLADKSGLDNLVDFFERDYTNAGFEDSSFDVVWAIESACHAQNKRDFLQEAYRVLKTGGRIIIADGFFERAAKDAKEKELINVFLEGLALLSLDSADQFKTAMKRTGFKNIEIWDKTGEIMPSAQKIYNMSRWSYPLSKITEKLKITSEILTKNNHAGIAQLYLIQKRIMVYKVFYGEK